MRAKPTPRNSSWLYINHSFVCSPTRSKDCFLCPSLGRAATREVFTQNRRGWLINNNLVISQHELDVCVTGCDIYLRMSIPFICRSLSFSAWLFIDTLCWVYAMVIFRG